MPGAHSRKIHMLKCPVVPSNSYRKLARYLNTISADWYLVSVESLACEHKFDSSTTPSLTVRSRGHSHGISVV